MQAVLSIYKASSIKEQYILQDILEDILFRQSDFFQNKTLKDRTRLGFYWETLPYVQKLFLSIHNAHLWKNIIEWVNNKEFEYFSEKIRHLSNITLEEILAYRIAWVKQLLLNNVFEEIDINWIDSCFSEEERSKWQKALLMAQKDLEKSPLYDLCKKQNQWDIFFYAYYFSQIEELYRLLLLNEGTNWVEIKYPLLWKKEMAKLICWEVSMQLQLHSEAYDLIDSAFQANINEIVYYIDVFERRDHAISEKHASRRGSSLISIYNQKIYKIFAIKDFFQTVKGWFYRTK